MPTNLARLIAVGFKQAGRWALANQVLRLSLDPSVMHERDVLYAFVVDGALMYVGKTTQSLIKRMQGYRSPASTAERGGSTNIKNNRKIIEALMAGATVDIYVLHALAKQLHGEFPVNLSAGLEDSLISALSPPWNGKNLSIVPSMQQDASASQLKQMLEPMQVLSSPIAPQQSISLLSNRSVVHSNTQLPSAEQLIAFCSTKRGELLATMTRKSPFQVEVIGGYLEITPGASRAARRESKSNIASLLSRLAITQSFQMSDYRDITFNASYVLALVWAWQREVRS